MTRNGNCNHTLLALSLALVACDKGDANPEVVEVPVPVLSAPASASASTLVQSQPKRYAEEVPHQGQAKVNRPELSVTQEANPDAPVVTKLAAGTAVKRLADVGTYSLIEFRVGADTKQGWVSSTGLEDIPSSAGAADVAKPTTSATATASAAPSASNTTTPTSSATPTATASTTASAAPADSTAPSGSAEASEKPKVRRGRLGR